MNQSVSVYDQLPKVVWGLRRDSGSGIDVPDYFTPDGKWGWRSSNIGVVDWEKEHRRNAFIAYDAVMRCPKFYSMTHISKPQGSLGKTTTEFEDTIMKRARGMIGGGSEQECAAFIQDIKMFVDAHPEIFMPYIESEALMRDPEVFVFHGESKG